MCLYIKDIVNKVATKDITCYKILRETKVGRETFFCTPFQEVFVKLGEEVSAFGDEDIIKRFVGNHYIPFRDYPFRVARGFIHTFKNYKDAKEFLESDTMQFDYMLSHSVLVKCTIPKGTEYYEGVFEDTGIPSYASKKVVYSKRISRRCY